MSPLCPRPVPAGPGTGPAGDPPGAGTEDAAPGLAGFLRCADCGKSMSRKTARGIVYYTCSTYRRKSKTACTKHTIREDRLRSQVAQALGVQPEALSRRLLFEQVREILVHEDGEVTVCPLPAEGASSV